MKIQSRTLLSVINSLVVILIRLIFKTTRLEYVGDSIQRCPFADTGSDRFLYSVWHDSVIPPLFCAVEHNSVALISQHRDADTIEAMLKAAGMGAIRGSTSRGGASAIKKLIKLAEGKHIVITPDGPRGPHHKMKPGIVFLASHSGRPVIPTAFTATRYWKFQGSWTSIWIPKPFSKVYYLVGEPIEVPENISREDMNYYTELVQEKMEVLEREVNQLVSETTSEEIVSFRKAA
ncbi:MAG: lysophospholipid acyltransferase family protein [Planctomycetota bacterium]|uniref:lysophospholipid acyltransferase family protein n=1 Tax=uncultured Gimesia sp. TaxID=1678688 RepID=UPI002603F4DF|nr:lysophospholipid acyltransferase family protein [uncultured Gimesia sp.]